MQIAQNAYQRESAVDQRYKYNGVELQDDLDLGMYMTDFRMFDPAVARLWQIDPIDKEDRSPYSWVLNNPILYNDILGLDTVRYDDLDDTPIDVDEDVVILDEVTVEAERPDASDEDTHLVPGFGLVKRGEKILPHRDGVPGFEDLFGKRKVGAGRLTFTVDVEGRIEGLAPMELIAPDVGGRNPGKIARIFSKNNIRVTRHFLKRLRQRAVRGVTDKNALKAYNKGKVFYDPKSKNFIRHDPQTRVSVVVDKPTNGKVITVFEGKPSPTWNIVKWRPN